MAIIQQMTGFQSPCSEYAEDELSLDQKFITDKPAMFFVRAGNNYDHFKILKNDLLVIHRGKQPAVNQVVVAVIGNNFVLAKYQKINGFPVLMPFNKSLGDVEEGEDFIWGVVSSIHRSMIV